MPAPLGKYLVLRDIHGRRDSWTPRSLWCSFPPFMKASKIGLSSDDILLGLGFFGEDNFLSNCSVPVMDNPFPLYLMSDFWESNICLSCFEAGLKKSMIDCFLSPGLSVLFPAAAGVVLPGLRWQRGGDDPGAGDEGKPGLAGMQRLVMSAPLATAA